MRSTHWLALSLCLFLAAPGCAERGHRHERTPPAQIESRPLPPVLASFTARLPVSRAQVPAIVAMAEDAARRTIENPRMLINVPYAEQPSFAEELLNRAGGLGNAMPPEERPELRTPQDVMLVSVRSWEPDGLQKYEAAVAKAPDSQIVLFASKAGMPEGVRYDYLIDNGAASGGHDEAAMNAIVNALNGWLWTVEYAAALTRHGKYPGTLLSIIMEESDEHNAPLQAHGPQGREPFVGELDPEKAIPPGELSRRYLRRVDRLIADLASTETRRQIDAAAQLIADHLAGGGKVGVATNTHILMSEIFENRSTPMHPFLVHGRSATAFPENVSEGDLVLYIAYVGMNTKYEDYYAGARASGATLVTSYVTDSNPSANAPEAAAHIEQHWTPPDAALEVPFPPGVIAPISGIDQALIYRMLEAEVARRLQASPTTQPAEEEAPAAAEAVTVPR